MTVSMNRPMVKLDRPSSVPDFLILSQHIVDRMTGNPWFTAAVAVLQLAQQRIDTLFGAETDALTLAKGLKSLRNAELRRLVSVMDFLKAHVQFAADENPQYAVEIIESAGMSVKGRSYPVKEPFSVRPLHLSGAVRLMVVAAAKLAQYQWQVSDDEKQTWKELPPTQQATTVVSGLTPQKKYWFRYRAVVRSGPQDWSEAISLIVR